MLSFFLSYLLIYKYAVLFVVITTASIGFPIPATALLMASGAFAAQGYFDLPSILIYGFFASIIGNVIGYFISFHYGRDILIRIGFKRMFASAKFRAIEHLFAHHSSSTIFLSRFIATGIGPVVNILSGLAKINYKVFFFYNILGGILYVIIFGGLWYIFGDQWETILQISQDVIIILVLLAILTVLFAVIWRAKNGKKR